MMGSKGPGSGTDGRVTGMHANIDTHADKKLAIAGRQRCEL